MNFLNNLLEYNIFKSLLIIIVFYILYVFIKNLLAKTLKSKFHNNALPAKHITYIRLFSNIFKYLFLCIAILCILQVNGINVSSLLAGLGIVSAIVGLSLQDALKDIIMGTNILTNDFFMVGDIIKYNDIKGKVLSLSLKNTKIQDIYNKDIISITNRNIDQITKLSDFMYISVPVPYEENVEKVEKVLNIACNQIKNSEHVYDCQSLSITEYADSSLIYKLEINCDREFEPTIKRTSLKCIKLLFNENKIDIPYNQIDIHTR